MRLKRPPFRYPWASSKNPTSLQPNKVKIAQWVDEIAVARATYDDRQTGFLPESKITDIKHSFETNGYALVGNVFQIQYADQMRATHKLDLDCTHAWSDLVRGFLLSQPRWFYLHFITRLRHMYSNGMRLYAVLWEVLWMGK